MPDEIWKDIKGYEGYYQVSNIGNVKSVERVIVRQNGRSQPVKERVLKSATDIDGYKFVVLQKEGKKLGQKVHRLVGQTFLPNENKLPQINHIDGVRSNNDVLNLEWVSPKQNQHHRHYTRKFGTKPNVPRGVFLSFNKTRWIAAIRVDGKSVYLGTFDLKEEAYATYFNKFMELYNYEPWDLDIYKTH